MKECAGVGPIGAATAGIAVCASTGLVMGLLITRLQVTPFIITLGGMSVLRGVAKGVADEQKIDVDPRGLDELLAPPEGGWVLPAGVWIALVIAIMAAAVLHHTRFGRHVFAVGSNEQTARLCGINVSGVRVMVYTLAAALTGVAGLME